MDKNLFIKSSSAIFIFLAVIISLFPPYEFGHEMAPTLSNPKVNAEMKSKLPVKKYDFLFSNDKKCFPLASYKFRETFQNKDSIQAHIAIWKKYGDKKFSLRYIFIDSFYTASYQKYNYADKNATYLRKGNRIIKYTIDNQNKDAINYKVRDYYKKAPNEWRFKRIIKFDSTKKYYGYIVTQPSYYNLSRRMVLSELMIEYSSALLLSLIAGYIIKSIKQKKWNTGLFIF